MSPGIVSKPDFKALIKTTKLCLDLLYDTGKKKFFFKKSLGK